jgi:hypothetical protein
MGKTREELQPGIKKLYVVRPYTETKITRIRTS